MNDLAGSYGSASFAQERSNERSNVQAGLPLKLKQEAAKMDHKMRKMIPDISFKIKGSSS